jgi:hypothetical protein
MVGTWSALTSKETNVGFTPFIALLETVRVLLIAHVDPEPLKMTVPAGMAPSKSDIVCPIATVPVTADVVRVDPAIEPVKLASGVLFDPTRIEMTLGHEPRELIGP